eukprot:1178529-Prorocentrum_minimum.AAC.8
MPATAQYSRPLPSAAHAGWNHRPHEELLSTARSTAVPPAGRSDGSCPPPLAPFACPAAGPLRYGFDMRQRVPPVVTYASVSGADVTEARVTLLSRRAPQAQT